MREPGALSAPYSVLVFRYVSRRRDFIFLEKTPCQRRKLPYWGNKCWEGAYSSGPTTSLEFCNAGPPYPPFSAPSSYTVIVP